MGRAVTSSLLRRSLLPRRGGKVSFRRDASRRRNRANPVIRLWSRGPVTNDPSGAPGPRPPAYERDREKQRCYRRASRSGKRKTAINGGSAIAAPVRVA